MEKIEKRHKYGLIGKNISYSFSRGYFTAFFKEKGLSSYTYENFDLPRIELLPALLKANPAIEGLSVTIPYKEAIIPFLDRLEGEARVIGAVNTIKLTNTGLIGYNTDAYGFQRSLEPYLKKWHTKALILGTGGASKAIAFVLNSLGIPLQFVSRNAKRNQLGYADLNQEIMRAHPIIINCSPVGTFPAIDEKPAIPYEFITADHLLYDLVYNPEKTAFLKEGESRGAAICNGLPMLQYQAEKAWSIWQG